MNNDHSWILYTVAPTFAVIQFPLIQSVTHYARSVTPVTSKSLDPYITDRLERPLFTMVIPLPSVSETLENLRRPSHTAFNVVYSWYGLVPGIQANCQSKNERDSITELMCACICTVTLGSSPL